MLNAHQLNVFLTAAENLNFTQAATQLNMSQPSVSQHIQALEHHFGLDLFYRSGRSIELTDAGLALLPLAREFIYLSTHIEETMASIKGDVYGHLMVGCSTTTGRYILPQLLANFHREYPQVRATCQVASQKLALQMLREGKVHLALTSTPKLCKEAEFRKFITDQTLLIVPMNHAWAEKGWITPQELTNTQFILPDEGSETHTAVREALASVGISIYQLKSVMELGSAEAIALSVQEGLGAGFVSNIVVNRLVYDRVKIIEIQDLNIMQDVYISRHPGRPQSSAQTAFWEFVKGYKMSWHQNTTGIRLNEISIAKNP
jgi:DNA-binding transcriptional LysR family regulator